MVGLLPGALLGPRFLILTVWYGHFKGGLQHQYTHYIDFFLEPLKTTHTQVLGFPFLMLNHFMWSLE